MVIERTYKCNMCNKVSTKSFGKDLIGLYWNAYPSGWTKRPSHEVENHICTECLESLQKIVNNPEAGKEEK